MIRVRSLADEAARNLTDARRILARLQECDDDLLRMWDDAAHRMGIEAEMVCRQAQTNGYADVHLKESSERKKGLHTRVMPLLRYLQHGHEGYMAERGAAFMQAIDSGMCAKDELEDTQNGLRVLVDLEERMQSAQRIAAWRQGGGWGLRGLFGRLVAEGR